MELTSEQLAVLRTHLDTTYVGKTNGTVHEEINDPEGPDAITDFDVAEISNVAAVAAVVGSEFLALSAEAQRGWLMILDLDTIPIKMSAIRSLVKKIWTPTTTTYANLVALQKRKGSHAEDLFGVTVSIVDIRRARK